MHLSILPTARISILFLNLKMMFSFSKSEMKVMVLNCKKIDMLFKRFETLGYTDPNFSSGIGLSLVKELVDMLHGSIMVDSKLGQGSVFSVSLSRSYEVFQSDKNVEFILNDSKTMPSIETQVEQKEEFIKDITVLGSG